MSLQPLLDASPIIQIHAFAAIAAFALGPIILISRKGDTRHRVLGRIWAVSMVVTIASSFFIFGIRLIGPFSPIHLLSISAAYGLFQGINFARRGNIPAHRKSMQGLYFGALFIAGAFTFLPGRIMSQVFFQNHEVPGFIFILAAVVIIHLGVRYALQQKWIR